MPFKSKRMTHADGKMHHLGTDERDVAGSMLLTAGMEEVRDIAELFQDAKETGNYREYLTCVGTFNDKKIGVMSSGHGCMPMAIAVEELNHLGVKNIIKIGSGISPISGIKPGTIIIPTGAVRGEGASKEYVGLEYPAAADMELLACLNRQCEEDGETTECGIVRSHDCYYSEGSYSEASRNRANKWADYGVLLIEHELSSMFVISSILKVKSAGIYVVEENTADGTKLTEAELKERLSVCYQIAAKVASRLQETMPFGQIMEESHETSVFDCLRQRWNR